MEESLELHDTNAKHVRLNQEPKIINDIVYIPLRVVSELLGFQVSWDSVKKEVLIRN